VADGLRGAIHAGVGGARRRHPAHGRWRAETYYWEPGHNLEAVTDAEYVEITRSEDYDALMAHCKQVRPS
jgi:hypothetical protein